MGFGEIGLRPSRGMIGMRVVEADDVFAALPAFALDADQFARIDVIAVLRRIGSSIAAAGDRVTVRTESSSIWPSRTPQHSCG